MYIPTNKLIVASLFAIASSFTAYAAPVNSTSSSSTPLTAINSQDDFCLFLPPQPGLVVAVNEDNGIPFCTKPDTVPNATEFPEGFITTAHYLRNSSYVQVTGFFDRTKYDLGESDGGGQYDNHAKGKPVAAQCQDYKYFVSMIEPDINRFCIRCCQEEADCNTGRSGYGCLRIIDGDYDNDNNYINNSSSSEPTSHLNSDMNSVLFDLEALPNNNAADASTATTTATTATSNANDAILAEVEKLSELTSAEEVQTQWTSFTSNLVTEYPRVFQQISQLNSIVSDLTTLEQWKSFFALVKEKIIQLQATTSADSPSSTTHTNSKEDLEWLFAHRNSHDNQATW
ncbi:conserved hypothetical protein [Mucor ambiguus]|uniref:Secreted protein n=1 Tax=Mucor ambiguus TaxID=91626 RepID=A0A0C9LU74_9FUNG|nr:conserved hypothetical protein [Mucor ambiguus]